MTLDVFIGSSSEESQEVDEIAAAIDRKGHHAIRWDRSEVFPPGTYTQKRLIDLTRQVDAALFVFGPDDRVELRGEHGSQPRDNVLIEYGLFLGHLGEKNVAFYRKGDARTARDVDGVTSISAPNGWNSLVERALTTWLRNVRPGWLTPGELEDHPHPTIRVYQTFNGSGAGDDPIVEDINAQAKMLFGIADANVYIGRPSGELMKVLQGFVEPPVQHWDDLVADQERVYKKFVRGLNATAQVAVRLNSHHGQYKGRIFVPLLVERSRSPLWGERGYREISTVVYLDIDRLPKHVFGEQIWNDMSANLDLPALASQFDLIAERLEAPEIRVRKVKEVASRLRQGGGPRVLELCSEVGLYSMLKQANGCHDAHEFLSRLLDPFPDTEAERQQALAAGPSCGS